MGLASIPDSELTGRRSSFIYTHPIGHGLSPEQEEDDSDHNTTAFASFIKGAGRHAVEVLPTLQPWRHQLKQNASPEVTDEDVKNNAGRPGKQNRWVIGTVKKKWRAAVPRQVLKHDDDGLGIRTSW